MEVLQLLVPNAGYNTVVVLIGVALFGVAAGAAGCFAVLRKRALVTDALAHATLPGVGAAFIVASALSTSRSLPILLVGAGAAALLASLALQAIVRHTRLAEDAAIGIVLSVFFGVGAVLITYIQSLATGDQAGLHQYIYGQTATLSAENAMFIGAVAAVVIVGIVLFFREMRLAVFDPSFAASIGLPVGLIDTGILAMIVLVTIIGLQAVGLLLVVALLVVPAVAARFWTERLPVMIALSSAIAALASVTGAVLSARVPDLPTGAVIVLVAGVLFLVSLAFGTSRGLVSRWLARRAIAAGAAAPGAAA
jgi:manganese/zinc/iron transport system permease protein